MIYEKIAKGEDGLYYARAFTDERKRNLIQLDNVTVADIGDEISFEVDSEKIDEIHETNIKNAIEKSEEWFGKSLQEKVLRSAYTKNSTISTEIIKNTKIFDHDKNLVSLENLTTGETCSVIVEFAGLWFAKKAFGPRWNLVQVKKQHTVEQYDESYPDEYMFVE